MTTITTCVINSNNSNNNDNNKTNNNNYNDTFADSYRWLIAAAQRLYCPRLSLLNAGYHCFCFVVVDVVVDVVFASVDDVVDVDGNN